MNKIYMLLIFSFVLVSEEKKLLLAQNIGINTTGSAPDNSAILDIDATDRGLLVPRVSLSSISDAVTIPGPATSLLVWNTNVAITGGAGAGYYYNAGTPASPNWLKLMTIGESANYWSLTGNAGTLDGTHFIGTINNVPINFRINNEKAGRIDFLRNAAFGYQAFSSNTTGTDNTVTGFAALYNNTTGSFNIAIGSAALRSNTTGSYTIAIGDSALYSYNGIDGNTAIGSRALRYNTGGLYNTATGYMALYNNRGGGNYNAAYGSNALYNNTTGRHNIAIGYYAMSGNITGHRNTVLGNNALITNTTGVNNTAIGYNTDVTGDNLSNATVIGYNAKVATSNSLVLGGTGADQVNVGIGTTSPNFLLQIGRTDANFTQDARIGLGTRNGSSNRMWSIGTRHGSTSAAPNYGFYIRDENANAYRLVIDWQNGNVAIGDSVPTAKLDVAGQVRIRGGTPGAGKVLTSDINGLASWQMPAPQTLSISGTTLSISGGNSVFLPANGSNTGEFISESGIVHNTTNIGNDHFVFGSTALDNIPASTDDNNRMYFHKGWGSFRAGSVDGSQWNTSNIGSYSVAFGRNTTASGTYSIAMGDSAVASAIHAVAMGNRTRASGFRSTAMGSETTASGQLSTATGNRTTASGTSSFASGYGSIASGDNSTAMGVSSIASGNNSTALGTGSIASGLRAIAIGNSDTASGINSIALGTFTKAEGYGSFTSGYSSVASGIYAASMGMYLQSSSYAEMVIGQYNSAYTPVSTSSWNAADRLFSVGNGVSNTNRHNALTILKNGNTGIGTDIPDATLHLQGSFKYAYGILGSGRVLTSDADGIANWQNTSDINNAGEFKSISGIVRNTTNPAGDHFVFGSSELNNITGADDDHRFFFNKTKGAFRAGKVNSAQWNDIYLGDYSVAFGNNTVADGEGSSAFGNNTSASGANSVSSGNTTTASGANATAMGYKSRAIGTNTLAVGDSVIAAQNNAVAFGYRTYASHANSTAMGESTRANGISSTAMGAGTRTQSFRETAVGSYNRLLSIEADGDTQWNPTDPLFSVGNGTSAGSTDNALVILKNGNVGIRTRTDPDKPTEALDVNGRVRIRSLADSLDSYFVTSDIYGVLHRRSYSSVSAAILDNAWTITGNNGTDDQFAFLGTRDTSYLNFRVNNQKAGRIEMDSTPGRSIYGNTVLGYLALPNNNPNFHLHTENTVIGQYALRNSTSGSRNVAIGAKALQSSISNADMVAVGYEALKSHTSIGIGSTALGSQALVSDISGTANTAVGYQSLSGNTSGSFNTAVGNNTLGNISTGNNNTAIGYGAGATLNNLSYTTAIGNNATVSASNATAIGYGATAATDNSLILGNSTAKVGIGTSAPESKLHIIGSFAGDPSAANKSSFPVIIEGGQHGIHINVRPTINGTSAQLNNGTANRYSTFVSFNDSDVGNVNTRRRGAIIGQTEAELLASDEYILQNAMYATQVAQLASEIVACGTQADLAEVAALTISAGLLAADIASYNAFTLSSVGVSYESGNADYAEYLEKYDPDEKIQPGDIIGVMGGKISKNMENAQKYMVASTAPLVVGNVPEASREKDFVKTAFMGQVPVKVLGVVNTGDYILPSGKGDGYGIAVHPSSMQLSDYKRIVGVAWSVKSFEEIGFVNVAVGINTNDMTDKLIQMQQQINVIAQYLKTKDPSFSMPEIPGLTEATPVSVTPQAASKKSISNINYSDFEQEIAQYKEQIRQYPERIEQMIDNIKAVAMKKGVNISKDPILNKLLNARFYTDWANSDDMNFPGLQLISENTREQVKAKLKGL